MIKKSNDSFFCVFRHRETFLERFLILWNWWNSSIILQRTYGFRPCDFFRYNFNLVKKYPLHLDIYFRPESAFGELKAFLALRLFPMKNFDEFSFLCWGKWFSSLVHNPPCIFPLCKFDELWIFKILVFWDLNVAPTCTVPGFWVMKCTILFSSVIVKLPVS